jgi:hypothetical protein
LSCIIFCLVLAERWLSIKIHRVLLLQSKLLQTSPQLI